MCCCNENYECEHRFIKQVRTHISCQGFHCTFGRSCCFSGAAPATQSAAKWQRKSSIQHPWYDERSRGVILKGREVRGFLDSGMAGLYEVKTEPCHMVEYLSTAALDLAMLNAQSQHNRLSADQIADELIVDYSSLHARTACATTNQRALAPPEKTQGGVCQNQSTHSLRDGQSLDT